MSNTTNARIVMENGAVIDLELYDELAPATVENFKNLVNRHFYDGLIFHRVISGFMIQGGDPTGTGCGGAEKNIVGEFQINGFSNPISHRRGAISMARAQDPNSASSQFFIMHQDGTFLDGQYAAFGKVTNGMETVDEIAGVQTDFNDRPLNEQRIQTIRIISE